MKEVRTAMRQLIVGIPTYLSTVHIEETLKTYFTVSTKAKEITFDLTKLRWTSPYTLSLMTLWIRRLSVDLNKSVTMIAPGHSSDSGTSSEAHNILSFLGKWGFWDALERFKVRMLINDDERMLRKKFEGFSERCIPLTFYSNFDTFEAFLASLDLPKLLQDTVGESVQLEFIGSGGFRSIVLREIGKNVFDHGDGIAAHITMGITQSVKGSSPAEISHKLQKRILSVPKYMQSFYRSLGNDPCLDIVVADHGKGIRNSLRNSYLEDNIIKIKEPDPSEHTLIRYAFLLHSSSKNDSWYFEAETGRKGTDYRAPRGLYFVKNIARRNKALLMCRSGRSLISFDFLSSPKGAYSTNLYDPRLKVLAPLGGTQIRLLVPLRRQQKKVLIARSIRESSDLPNLPIKALRLQPYFTKQIDPLLPQKIVNDIHRHAIRGGKQCFLLIDFIGTTWNKETLFPIINEMLFLGLDSYKFVAINCEEYIADFEEMYSIEPDHDPTILSHNKSWHRQRPFLIFMKVKNNTGLQLITHSSKSEEDIFNDIFYRVTNGESVDASLIPEVLDHLVVEGVENNAVTTFSPSHLLNNIYNYEMEYLKDIISNNFYGIRHDGKFLLPNMAYSETFYEIMSIFDSKWQSALLTNVLAHLFAKHVIDNSIILTISKLGNKIGELLSICMNNVDNVIVTHRNVNPKDNPMSFLLKIPRGIPIYILDDVIATGNSIRYVIDCMHNIGIAKNLMGIFSIADVRSDRYYDDKFIASSSEWKLITAIKVPTRLYVEDKPKDWAWSEIDRVDTETWKIKPPEPKLTELVDPMRFIKNVIHQAKAVTEGHYFADKGNHFSYFFITKRICEKFGQDFAKSIAEDAKHLVSVRSSYNKITHIVYPASTIGLDDIIYTLRNETGAESVQVGQDFVINEKALSHEMQSVIILDSAISSGETLWDLLETVTQLGAKAVFGYAIINRASRNYSLRIFHTERYNKADTTINQIVAIRIPTYKSSECPLCQRIKDMEAIKKVNSLSLLHSTAQAAINDLVPQPITQFLKKEWKHDIDDFDRQEQRVVIRMNLQRASHNEQDAWASIMSILELNKQGEDDKRCLIDVLFREINYFRGDSQLFPGDFRLKLFELCLSYLLKELNWRHAVTVAAAMTPNLFCNRISEIVEALSFDYKAILYVLTELLLQRNQIAEQQLLESVLSIKVIVVHMNEEGIGLENGHMILQATDQIIRGLKIEMHLMSSDKTTEIKHLIGLRESVFKKGLGVHSKLKELWTNIVGLTHIKACNIINEYYYGGEGYYHTIADNILPNLLSMHSTIASLLITRYPYFKNQIEKDIDLLHNAVVEIDYLCKKGALERKALEGIWDTEALKQARKRISLNIVDSDSPLKRFLHSLFCSASEEIEGRIEHWKAYYDAISIETKWKDEAGKVQIFLHLETYQSVLNNLLENIYKYAFNGLLLKGVYLHSYIEHGKYILDICDNGIGISEVNKDKLLNRLRNVLEPFAASVYINSNEIYSTIVTICALKKESLP